MPFDTREAYLTEAAALLLDEYIIPAGEGMDRPPIRISVGWPRGTRTGKVIAQCFVRAASSDGVNEIFVSPELDDPVLVMGSLAHELIHAMDDCQSGHRNYFARVARRIGLEGPLTATVPGDDLSTAIKGYADLLGEYPHHRMDVDKGRKKQTTRLLKCECGSCGFVARVSAKWTEQLNPNAVCPLCESQSFNAV